MLACNCRSCGDSLRPPLFPQLPAGGRLATSRPGPTVCRPSRCETSAQQGMLDHCLMPLSRQIDLLEQLHDQHRLDEPASESTAVVAQHFRRDAAAAHRRGECLCDPARRGDGQHGGSHHEPGMVVDASVPGAGWCAPRGVLPSGAVRVDGRCVLGGTIQYVAPSFASRNANARAALIARCASASSRSSVLGCATLALFRIGLRKP